MSDETAPAPAPIAAPQPTYADVKLSQPIQRGETSIESLRLRKPRAGELRGLSLQDVITSDISTLLSLIPRISDPPLVAHEADGLDPADLAEMGGVVRGFFMTAAERQVLEAMIAEQQPRT